MSSLLAAPLLIAAAQGIIPPLVGPLIPDSNGTVTGIIRRADTGQLMPEVLVAVAGATESPEKAIANAVSTDRNGRFTIRNVLPGTYSVVAQRDGFFSPSAQTAASVQVGPSVTTFEGEVSDVGVMDLIPGAAISGRIAGPDGLPLASAPVQALRASYMQGRRTLTPIKTILTDDLGDYRLFWLPPGAYYVRAQYRSTTPDHPERYERMFFPGIAEEDAAPSILVGAGSEVSGIDLRVPTTPVRGVTLSGRVSNASDDAPEGRISAVYVVPRGRKVHLADDGADMFPNQAASASNGQFEIRNVSPGSYDLFPMSRDSSGRVRTVRIAIDVEDRDLDDVNATLDPPVSLRGKVTLDGGAPGDRLAKALLLRSLEELPEAARSDAAIIPDSETGEFLLPLPPGRYAIQPAPPLISSNAFIADVKRGESSVLDSGFTVLTESEEPLVVEIRSKAGTVLGTVIDPTRLRPAPYATVALVPEATRRKNFALYREEKSRADGSFQFTSIPPGNYKLFAWQSVSSGAWEDAAFLERFEDRGVSLVVGSGADTKVQINLIP